MPTSGPTPTVFSLLSSAAFISPPIPPPLSSHIYMYIPRKNYGRGVLAPSPHYLHPCIDIYSHVGCHGLRRQCTSVVKDSQWQAFAYTFASVVEMTFAYYRELLLVAHGCCSLATEPQSDLVPESNATKQAHAQAHRPGVRSPFSQGDPHYTGENGDGGSPFSWGPQNFMTPALQTGLRNCSRTFALNFGRENDGKPLVLYAT